MRLLLDTHIFLWLITNDDRLTADLRNVTYFKLMCLTKASEQTT